MRLEADAVSAVDDDAVDDDADDEPPEASLEAFPSVVSAPTRHSTLPTLAASRGHISRQFVSTPIAISAVS